MTENKIPQYHPSYSEEENRSMYEYIKSATNRNLVNDIFHLCSLYSDQTQEKVKAAFYQFGKEIADREYLQNCYQELISCRDLWKQYRYSLETYPDVLRIRHAYQKYKEAPGIRPDGGMLEVFIGNCNELLKVYYSEEMIRRFLLSENSKNGIKRPHAPEVFYESISEIPVQTLTPDDALALLKKEELEHIMIILLNYADSPDEKNCADVILSFLTRKYSYTSHKKIPAAFSSNTLSYSELKDRCSLLLTELKELKEETVLLEQKQ